MKLYDVYEGWAGYETSLVHAIEPLSREPLEWKQSSQVRSVGEIARHIALGRINWFVRMKAPGSDPLAARVKEWHYDPHGSRYVVEEAIAIDRDAACLKGWLEATRSMIDETLKTWSVDDLPIVYTHVWRGEVYEISRQWTLWRVMAHDIHHGDQIARILAERGIEAVELRALGGHIVSPRRIGATQRGFSFEVKEDLLLSQSNRQPNKCFVIFRIKSCCLSK